MSETISRKEIEDLSWLAGIIDGEGSFYLSLNVSKKDSRIMYSQIRIPNVDMFLIEKVTMILSRHSIKYYYNRKPSDLGHDVITICVKAYKHCMDLISILMPYLCNKKLQATAMLDVLMYVGNFKGYDYVDDDKFLELLTVYTKEKEFYQDPINLKRKANNALLEKHPTGRVSNVDLSYLAGIIDGEGYVTAVQKESKGKMYCFPILEVANTDNRMLGKISQIYEALNLRFHYTYSRKSKYNPNHKNVLYIRITSQGSTYKLLLLLMPFFTSKKKMAKAVCGVLEFIKSHREAKCGGLYTNKEEFKKLFAILGEDKYMYFDPQRLICTANTPLVLDDRAHAA